MFAFSESRNLLSEYYRTLTIQIVAFIIYFSVITISYNCYDNEFKNRKNEILNEYYKIISNYSLIKLNHLLQKLPLDQSGIDTVISVDQSDILSCFKQQCIRSNLFEFTSIIDKYIPNFIYYRIDLNKQVLHRNIRIDYYELEKTYHINNYNQLSILVSADSKYWDKIKKQTIKPFLVTIISSSFLLILFILSNKLLNKYIKKFYFSYYKNHYDSELERIKEDYQKELTIRENALMKKIWNLEYSKEKDTELNYLFSQEANKLAVLMQGAESFNTNPLDNCKNSPCSVILYYNQREQETVNTKNLIEIFSNRFANSEDNISILITSSEQSIKFASKESLYQIIYSVINYIIFILKEQSCTFKYNLKFNILNKQSKLCLFFEYDGFPIHNEEDLLKFSNKFLKKNVNLFLLSLNQIFHILRIDNFNCKVGHSELNFIEITKNTSAKNLNKVINNIIQLPIKHE
jgi:hypothetical protein